MQPVSSRTKGRDGVIASNAAHESSHDDPTIPRCGSTPVHRLMYVRSAMRMRLITVTFFVVCGCKSGSDGKAATPAAPTATDSPKLTFFITSAGPGQGGNLGGLEGADAHCKKLAEA